MNGDYKRLVFVNETIQARIWEDTTWAAIAAVDVYEMLALTIDPEFSVSNLPMRGAYLVRNELMSMCQVRFQQMILDTDWNRGLISFLGQLCTMDKITSTTPSIVLHIMDNMIVSTSLQTNDNFDLLMSFLMLAGPYHDSQEPLREHLTARLQQLHQRGQSFDVCSWLALEGLLQLRGRDWQMEAVQDGSLSDH